VTEAVALRVGRGVGIAGELRGGELGLRGGTAEVFDEARGDLIEEARGDAGVGHLGAVAAAIAGASEDKRVHGAGHADVAEAAFLFEAGGFEQRARVGEETFFEAGEEDEGKLKALGGVQRHQGDARLGAVGVGVGDEGRVVEKVGERFAALLGVLRGVGQLAEVLDAGEGLGRGLVFQRADVARAVVEELDELGRVAASPGARKAASLAPSRRAWAASLSSAMMRSAARSAGSSVALDAARRLRAADFFRTTEAKGLKWAESMGPVALSAAMAGIASAGPSSKPKLKLVSGADSRTIASFVADSVANSMGLKFAADS